MEFGGSGEDSFVAVVVTKLTGALLFILLLAMVIMALLPKATEVSPLSGRGADSANAGERAPLTITTPETLPEAIAGRPYTLALAASGGGASRHWSVDGPLPEGLALNPSSGLLQGTPSKGTPQPLALAIRVSDGSEVASRPVRLVVFQSDRPLTTPAWWKPGIPPIPWRMWLEQGFGFLLLGMVHIIGMNALSSLERGAGLEGSSAGVRVAEMGLSGGLLTVRRRFLTYRILIRASTLLSLFGLTAWLVLSKG